MFNQAAVSYPTAARTLNQQQLTFSQQPNNQQQQNQQQSQQQIQQHHQQTSNSQSKFSTNRGLFSGTGTVTSIQGECGVIDEECCFYRQNCVKGIMPKLGDRVLVEATTNHKNVSFKWQATRVQVLSSSSLSSANLSSANHSSSKPSSNYSSSVQRDSSVDLYRSRRDYSPPRRSPRRRSRERSPRIRETAVSFFIEKWKLRDFQLFILFPQEDIERKKRREEREKEREKRERERKKSESPRRSPKRKKPAKIVPRYLVQIPKIELTIRHANVLELKNRYNSLYVPSDFADAEIKWVDVFPVNAPLTLKKPCSFHVMHKEVNPIKENNDIYDPPDADYLYSAKVCFLILLK